MADEAQVHSTIPGARVRREFVLACARRAAALQKVRLGGVNFVLVDDRRMARLHRNYSGLRGTTDVLTFNLAGSAGAFLEGDVFICLDQARRQAREYGVPLYEEVARLAIHGVLHLAGLDDHTPAARARMRLSEDRVLAAARRAA